MQSAEIETSEDSLDGSSIFHIINDVVGFVLFMHQQIPSILQDMSVEYDMLLDEYKEMELALARDDMKPPIRRKHNSRMREIKQGTRRLDKFMKTVSGLQTALQLILKEVPDIKSALLVLGASPLRPMQVYEISFSCGNVIPRGSSDFTKSRDADMLSRKAIRRLTSMGVGSVSYPGASKLFLLVKAPSSVNLPLHFVPKRDFKYSKKIVPTKLLFKCKTLHQEIEATTCDSQTGSSNTLKNFTSDDAIWFQCRHVVKGLPSGEHLEE